MQRELTYRDIGHAGETGEVEPLLSRLASALEIETAVTEHVADGDVPRGVIVPKGRGIWYVRAIPRTEIRCAGSSVTSTPSKLISPASRG